MNNLDVFENNLKNDSADIISVHLPALDISMLVGDGAELTGLTTSWEVNRSFSRSLIFSRKNPSTALVSH